MTHIHQQIQSAHEDYLFILCKVSNQCVVLSFSVANAHRIGVSSVLMPALDPMHYKAQKYLGCVEPQGSIQAHCHKVILMVEAEGGEEGWVVNRWDHKHSKQHHVEGVEDQNAHQMFLLPMTKLVCQDGKDLIVVPVMMLK